MTKNYYFGNYPTSASYDPNIPIGKNKWDELECEPEETDEEDDGGDPYDEISQDI